MCAASMHRGRSLRRLRTATNRPLCRSLLPSSAPLPPLSSFGRRALSQLLHGGSRPPRWAPSTPAPSSSAVCPALLPLSPFPASAPPALQPLLSSLLSSPTSVRWLRRWSAPLATQQWPLSSSSASLASLTSLTSALSSSLLRLELPKSLEEFLSREAKKGREAVQAKKGGGSSAAAGSDAQADRTASGGGAGGGGSGGWGKDSKGDENKAGPSAGDGEASKKKKAAGGSGPFGGDSKGRAPGLFPQYPGLDRTLVVLVGLLALLWALESSRPSKEITFQDFRNNFLETGKVQRLLVNAERKTVAVQLKPEGAGGHGAASDDLSTEVDGGRGGRSASTASKRDGKEPLPSPSLYFAIGSVEAFERALEEAQREMGLDPRDHVQVKYETEGTTLSTVFSLLQVGVLVFVAWQVVRGMAAMGGGGLGGGGGAGRGGRNIFSIGKSPATLIKPGEMTKTTFGDVAGLDEAKVEVMEFIKFLKGAAPTPTALRLRHPLPLCPPCVASHRPRVPPLCGLQPPSSSPASARRSLRALCWLDLPAQVAPPSAPLPHCRSSPVPRTHCSPLLRCCSSVPALQARRCWPRRWPVRRRCRSSPSAAATSWRCSSAWAPRV